MTGYHTHFSKQQTPQSTPIPGRESEMKPNEAGGYVFAIDDWTQLDRFLILGNEGGSYYASEQKMTVKNAQAVMRCIKADGERVLKRVHEISVSGRAAKQDPALFVLALLVSESVPVPPKTFNEIVRIGTHLFNFTKYVTAQRGWGRQLRRLVQHWYQDKEPDALAYQLTKYQQRGGWSHRDMLRLAHPKADYEKQNALYEYACGKGMNLAVLPALIQGIVEIGEEGLKPKQAASFIREYRLVREVIPTNLLSSPEVWDALLENMPMTAMIRNLGKMSQVGLLTSMSAAARTVVKRLQDQERLRKARIHPISILAAMKIYQAGEGFRGKLTWDPVQSIVDALDAAFYLCFQNVKPSGKRLMLALDISGSMTFGDINGMPFLTPRDVSAALALVTASVESDYCIHGFHTNFIELNISPRQRLDDVVRYIGGLGFGGTDCALPMRYAREQQMGIDAFVIYTDNETWFGNEHPCQALQQYRRKMNNQAKLVIAGMTATESTIGDRADAGTLDVVGFDTATPTLISDFIS